MKLPLTIVKLQAGLKSKEYSAVELVDEYLARIKELDGELNSFNTVSDDTAYDKAKEVDKLISDLGDKAFADFPLLGVVVAHKDMFLTKGIRTTASSNVLKDFVPVYSATVVDRLDKAGCITIGKTNCDAWAHGASGENSDFGPTKNPWNKEYVPGGSSSGSAASVSANLTTIATGTDTGGSIRFPASFCGIYGLKPTYGSVSRYGIVAMASSTDSIGHMARTAADMQRVFDVTKGADGHDSCIVSQPPMPKSKTVKTIGLPKEYFINGVEKEVSEKIDEVIKTYEKLGIKFKEISLRHTKQAIAVYYIVQPAEVSSNLGRYDGIRYGDGRNSFGAEAKRRIMLGTYVLSAGYYDAYYKKAMQVRTLIRKDFDMAFEKVDAILTPVSPHLPFKIGEKVNDPISMYLEDVFMSGASLSGNPGLAVPAGFSKRGLPIGFQLIGQRFDENTLFDLAHQFEKTTKYEPKVAD